MSQLSSTEILKHYISRGDRTRVDVFLAKLTNHSPFKTVDGNDIILYLDQQIIHQIDQDPLILKTIKPTTIDGVQIKWGQLQKTEEFGAQIRNFGNVVEVIVGATLMARLLSPTKTITQSDVINIINDIIIDNDQTSIIKQYEVKQRSINLSINSPKNGIYPFFCNESKRMIDVLILSSVRWINESSNIQKMIKYAYSPTTKLIDVVVDGISNSSQSKTDVCVIIDHTTRLKLSIKALNVSQFSQVAGVRISHQQQFWKSIIGIDISPGVDPTGVVDMEFLETTWKDVATIMSQRFNSPAHINTMSSNLISGITYHATKNDPDVILLHIGKNKLGDYDELEFKLDRIMPRVTNLKLDAKYKDGRSCPTIQVYDRVKQTDFIQLRVKREGTYIRSLIEKGKLFTSIFTANETTWPYEKILT